MPPTYRAIARPPLPHWVAMEEAPPPSGPLRIIAWMLGIAALCAIGAYALLLLFEPDAPPRAPVTRPAVLATYPHDPTAFTQGLLLRGGVLYESTGLYGQSRLQATVPQTGRLLWQRPLPGDLFGEGLAGRPGGGLMQLTWREGVALRWQVEPGGARIVGRDAYRGEGWGLARAGSTYLMSDGSDRLQVRDVATFRTCRVIPVTDGGHPVGALNELEVVGREVWANVWQTDRIVQIDPTRGEVTRTLDLSHLRRRLPEGAPVDVLNGIAWERARGRVLVTGKNWPRLFAIPAPRAPRALDVPCGHKTGSAAAHG